MQVTSLLLKTPSKIYDIWNSELRTAFNNKLHWGNGAVWLFLCRVVLGTYDFSVHYLQQPAVGTVLYSVKSRTRGWGGLTAAEREVNKTKRFLASQKKSHLKISLTVQCILHIFRDSWVPKNSIFKNWIRKIHSYTTWGWCLHAKLFGSNMSFFYKLKAKNVYNAACSQTSIFRCDFFQEAKNCFVYVPTLCSV